MTQNDAETYKEFKYVIRLDDTGTAAEYDYISSVKMKVKLVERDDNDNILTEDFVGQLTGTLVTQDFGESGEIYHALDGESSDLEEIAMCLQAIEEGEGEDAELADVTGAGHGYLIIENIHFNPKYERTGVEQSIIKTLVTKLGNTTHGVIVHPLKEVRVSKDEIDYDRSPAAMAYMQKIFRDVGFKPIKGTPFFGFWTAYAAPKMEKVPTLISFELTGKLFKVDISKIYESKPVTIDSPRSTLPQDFSGDLVYQLADQLGVSPEAVVKNHMSERLRARSKLLQYAERVGANPVEVIRRDRAIRGN